jgi:hypothetical protein
MIHGVVNLRREATLSLVVGNSSGQREVINTVKVDKSRQFCSQPSQNWDMAHSTITGILARSNGETESAGTGDL